MDPCIELNPVHKTLFKPAAVVFARQRLCRYCVPATRGFRGFAISQRAGWMHDGTASHRTLLNNSQVLTVSVSLGSGHGTWQKMVRWCRDRRVARHPGYEIPTVKLSMLRGSRPAEMVRQIAKSRGSLSASCEPVWESGAASCLGRGGRPFPSGPSLGRLSSHRPRT